MNVSSIFLKNCNLTALLLKLTSLAWSHIDSILSAVPHVSSCCFILQCRYTRHHYVITCRTIYALVRLTLAGLVTPQATCSLTLWGTKSLFPFFPFWCLHPELAFCPLCCQHFFSSLWLTLSASLPLISCSPVKVRNFSHSRRLYSISEQHSSISFAPGKLHTFSPNSHVAANGSNLLSTLSKESWCVWGCMCFVVNWPASYFVN